jgi:plasmid stabilization system protein ParE
VKVVWTNTAKRSLRTIHDYIAQNSPAYAQRIVDKLTSRSKQIGAFRFQVASFRSSSSSKSAKC